MKPVLSCLFFLLISSFYGQHYNWVKTDPSLCAYFVAVDKNENLFAAGQSCITRFDSTGKLIWERTLKDFGIRGIACDTNSNLYTVGTFYGKQAIGNYTVDSGEENDMFLAKFNSSGEIEWLIQSYGNYMALGEAITVDAMNNIVICGRFFVEIQIDTFKFSGPNTSQIFLAKFSSSGACIIGKHLKSASFGGGSVPPKLKSDFYGNTFISGHYIFDATFDSIKLNAPMDENVFLSKMDSAGSFLWARSLGGNSQETSGPMSVDENGNIYISGYFFSDTAYFGNKSLVRTGAMGNNFIARYNTSGYCEWVKYGNPGTICAVDNGYYTNHPSLISKYDTLGNLLFTKYAFPPHGMEGNVYNANMAHNDHAVYIAGGFIGDIKFDNILLSAPNPQMFIAKLSDASLMSDIEETEIADESGIWIYPNPCGGSFTLQCKVQAGEKVFITIRNVLGQLVYSENMIPGTETLEKTIDLSSGSKGVYFIEMLRESSRSVSKLVVD